MDHVCARVERVEKRAWPGLRTTLLKLGRVKSARQIEMEYPTERKENQNDVLHGNLVFREEQLPYSVL